MQENKITTLEMEVALAKHFDFERNVVVPNISHSFFNYELDLFIITKSRYGYEVEIKVSLSDLKKDLNKHHKHINPRIKYLYFAIPEKLINHVDIIPSNAGILVVRKEECQAWNNWRKMDKLITKERTAVRLLRRPQKRSDYKFTDNEYSHLILQGYKRIWGLKEKLMKNNQEKVTKNF